MQDIYHRQYVSQRPSLALIICRNNPGSAPEMLSWEPAEPSGALPWPGRSKDVGRFYVGPLTGGLYKPQEPHCPSMRLRCGYPLVIYRPETLLQKKAHSPTKWHGGSGASILRTHPIWTPTDYYTGGCMILPPVSRVPGQIEDGHTFFLSSHTMIFEMPT